MPSRDTQWVIGVIVAAVIILSTQNAGVHQRIDDLHQRVDDLAAAISDIRADLAALDDRLSALDDRLRGVDVAFGKVA